MKKFFTAAALFALSLFGCSCSASESVSVEPPRNLSTGVDELHFLATFTNLSELARFNEE